AGAGILIVGPLLREGAVDFQGRYYRARNCLLSPRGPSGSIPTRTSFPQPSSRSAFAANIVCMAISVLTYFV
ncbi:MAG: hypothetical protein J0H60_12660, partial [Rhizobiales bacterium]|nr:hypothetical protein [Hyphomicrobiales bacterium]